MRPADATAVRSTFSSADLGLFVLLSGSWGLSFLFIKVAVGAVSPLWIVALRTTVGGAVLILILHLRGRRLPRGARAWLDLLVLALLSNAVPWTLVAWAQQTIPSGLAAVVNSLVPASTLAVAVLVGVERLTGRRVVGLALAVVGTVVVVSGELGQPGRASGVAIVAAATLLYGSSAVYAKRYVSGRHAPLAVATGQVIVAAVLSLPVAALVGPTPRWGDLDGGVVASIAILGAVGTGVAFLLFYLLIERVGPTNATMVTYVIPVIGVAAGWALLGERFGWHVLAGGAVIVLGIWLAQREVHPTVEEDLAEIHP